MRGHAKELEALGVQVLMIDPHEPYRVSHMLPRGQQGSGPAAFTVLADPSGSASAAYGVAMQMRIHGEWSNRPATFIVDRSGVIRFQHLAATYSDRPKVDKIVQVVRRLSGVPAEPSQPAGSAPAPAKEPEPAGTFSHDDIVKAAAASRSGYTIATLFHPRCPGCLTEAIALARSRDVWKKAGVPVLGLALASTPEDLAWFAKTSGAKYRLETSPWITRRFKLRFFPTLIILDRWGKEVFRAAEDVEDPVKAAREYLEDKIRTSSRSPRPVTPPFEPMRVVRPFPPITNVPVLQAAAVQEEVRPAELVLGVEVKGRQRAYPINMLTGPRREVINDVLGGRAIAATW